MMDGCTMCYRNNNINNNSRKTNIFSLQLNHTMRFVIGIKLNMCLLVTVFLLAWPCNIVDGKYWMHGDGDEIQSDDFGGYYPRNRDGIHGYQDDVYGGGHDGYMSDYSHGWSPHGSQPKCVDIPSNLTLCKDIGYAKMRLPNLLEHDTLREVTSQASTWVRLTRIECHPNTKIFLCSLFSPVCLDRPIYPCRKLCEEVKSGCESRMLKYGYPWPEMLQCDQFPLDNDLCIKVQTEDREETSTCAACSQPNTFEAIVDNFCRTDAVLRVKLKREIESGGEKKILVGKKKRIYKKGNLRKRDLNDLELYVENSQKCDCGLPAVGHEKDYYFVMGVKTGNRFLIQAMHLYDKSNLEMRRALRAIRKKNNICDRSGIEMLAINAEDLGIDQVETKHKQPKQNVGEKVMTALDQTTEAYIATTTAKIIAPNKKSRRGGNKKKSKSKNRQNKKQRNNERNKQRNKGQT